MGIIITQRKTVSLLHATSASEMISSVHLDATIGVNDDFEESYEELTEYLYHRHSGSAREGYQLAFTVTPTYACLPHLKTNKNTRHRAVVISSDWCECIDRLRGARGTKQYYSTWEGLFIDLVKSAMECLECNEVIIKIPNGGECRTVRLERA